MSENFGEENQVGRNKNIFCTSDIIYGISHYQRSNFPITYNHFDSKQASQSLHHIGAQYFVRQKIVGWVCLTEGSYMRQQNCYVLLRLFGSLSGIPLESGRRPPHLTPNSNWPPEHATAFHHFINKKIC